MHIGRNNQVLDCRMYPTGIDHEAGNNAANLSAVFQNDIGERSHQPTVADSVNTSYLIYCQQLP